MKQIFEKIFPKFVVSAGIIMLVILVINFPAQAQTRRGNKMNQTKKTKIVPGSWGGTGIGLTIEDVGLNLEFDCAAAEITQSLMIDKKGIFSLEGFYIRRYPGAIRINLITKKQAAKFEGKISGKTMMLKIMLTEDGKIIGEFRLERGKTPVIRRCA